MDDVETLGRLREQAIVETEQLNSRNTQLADLNNELTQRIQGQFKASKIQPSGLGIYDGSEIGNLILNDRPQLMSTMSSSQAGSSALHDQSADGQVFVAEKLYKHGAQQKKFFWKKPAVTMLKGAGKGFNRVFQSENQHLGDGQGAYESYGTAQDMAIGKTEKGSKWRKDKKNANGNGNYANSAQDISGNGSFNPRPLIYVF